MGGRARPYYSKRKGKVVPSSQSSSGFRVDRRDRERGWEGSNMRVG